MYAEVVGTILASLGGASVIVAGFAHVLGKIWTDRISKETAAKFDIQIEQLKSKNTIALEEFKARSSTLIKEKEQFAGISQEFYQEFLRIVWLRILNC